MTLYILLAINIGLILTDIIIYWRNKRKIDNKIENVLLQITQNNENVGKLNIKVSKNGDDIQKIKQEKTAFMNELKSIHNTIETLNNGFAIPSYKNT